MLAVEVYLSTRVGAIGRRRRYRSQAMADVTHSLLFAGFVETLFQCSSCGLSGTSLSRPSALLDRTCAECNEPVVSTVFDRFSRG